MTYHYRCPNENCKLFDITIEIQKPAKDSDRKESCEFCAMDLERVWVAPSVKTSDGFKK
jgi:hypothetical protein